MTTSSENIFEPQITFSKFWLIFIALFLVGISFLAFQDITAFLIPSFLILFVGSFELQKVKMLDHHIKLQSIFPNPLDFLHNQQVNISDISSISIGRIYGHRSIGYTRVFIQDKYNKKISFPLWLYKLTDIQEVFNRLTSENHSINLDPVSQSILANADKKSLENYEAGKDFNHSMIVGLILLTIFLLIFLFRK